MLERLRQNAESWGIKIAFAIIIIVFVFYFGVGSFNEKKEPVVAYVNGDPISAREFQTAYDDAVTAMRRKNPGASAEELNTPKFKQAILDQLVNTRLLLAAAKDMGISVSPAELRSIISSIPAFKGANGAFDNGIYKNVLAQNNLTPARFEEETRSDQIIQKLERYASISALMTEPEAKSLFEWARQTVRMDSVLFPEATYAAQVTPTEAQIKAAYDAGKNRYTVPARIRLAYVPITVAELAAAQKITDDDVKKQYAANAASFRHPAQILARHILLLVPPEATQAAADKVLQKLKGIQAQLKSGANFADLAKKYSQDPASAKAGGELPWFSEGAMVKPFEAAVATLKPHEVSGPVRTQYGWHLIQLEARRPAGTITLEEATPQIKKTLAEERASEKINEILDQSMDQIAAGVKLEKIAGDMGLSLQKSDMLDLGQVQSQFNLKKEAAQTLFGLADGAAAKTPLAMENGRGYLLAEKLEGTPATVLPLDQVRDKVAAGVKAEEGRKLALQKAQAVLNELRGDAASQAKAMAELSGRIRTSAPLDRQSAMAAVGGNPQLLEDLFAAANANWFSKPYETPDGVLLARMHERIPAPEGDWSKEKGAWMAQGASAFREEIFESLLENLRTKAKIEIVRQDLVN